MVTKTKEQETDVVFESPLKVNIALLQNGTSKSHFLTRDSNAKKFLIVQGTILMFVWYGGWRG